MLGILGDNVTFHRSSKKHSSGGNVLRVSKEQRIGVSLRSQGVLQGTHGDRRSFYGGDTHSIVSYEDVIWTTSQLPDCQ